MATTVDTTGTQVLAATAALLNDVAQQVYTNPILLPYLNMAMRELQEFYEHNNIPVTDTVSEVIQVDAGVTSIGFAPTPPVADTPYLPDDLIEPKIVWERQRDVNPFLPMTRLDALPRQQEGVLLNQFIWYTWQSNEIRVMESNQDNDLKLDYIRNLFAEVTDVTLPIRVVNCISFLQFRTASLAAQFMMENPTRAQQLDTDASLALERALGIGTKGRQKILIRHKPFRASYKRRSYF